MNMNQLKIFHSVALLQSFTRASEALHLTQPGISKHVKALEEYYGAPLFDRLGRRVVLTQAGEILYQATSSLFALLEESKLRIDDLTDLSGGRLQIGGSVTIATYILPSMLTRYRKLAPGVEIAVATGFRHQILEKVLDNSLEVGFVGDYQPDPRLTFRRFMTDGVALIASPQHPWVARKEPVQFTELSDQTFLLSGKGSGTWRLLTEFYKNAGVVLKETMELGTTEAVKQGVAAGLGVSIVARHVIGGELARGLVLEIPLQDHNLKRDLFIVHHKDRYLSKAARAFLCLFEEAL